MDLGIILSAKQKTLNNGPWLKSVERDVRLPAIDFFNHETLIP